MIRKFFPQVAPLFLTGIALVLCLLLSTVCVTVASAHQKKGIGRAAAFHHRIYALYPRSFGSTPASLPRSPEYGFLNHVPANAIRGPGYTFVPGVGILGESCDLPSSACTNEYRDVQ
jgi:hypothetical protein